MAAGCFLVNAADESDETQPFKFADKGDSGALIYFINKHDQHMAAGLVMHKLAHWTDSRRVVHHAPTVAFLLQNGITALRETLSLSVAPAAQQWHKTPLKVRRM